MQRWASTAAVMLAWSSPGLGQALPLSHLQNNAEVAEASIAIGTFRRSGFGEPGDQGSADYTAEARACPLHHGAGDGGSQLPMRNGCAFINWQSVDNRASLPVFGARCVGDGAYAAIDTKAALAAAATGHDVYLPANNYCIFLEPLRLSATGQRVIGDGPQASKILVYTVFGGSQQAGFDAGVITLGAPAQQIRGIGISFSQPSNPKGRADLTTYQPAIMARQTTAVLSDILIAGGTTCVDMGGNTNAGNSVLLDVQTGCYDLGIQVDGSLDTVSIVRPHHSPLQMNAAQTAIFQRPDNVAIDLGRVDDYAVEGGLCLGTTCLRLRDGAQGGPFGTVHGYDFDGAAIGIDMTTPRSALTGSALTFSSGSSKQRAIVQRSGRLVIAGSSFFAAAATTLDFFYGGMQTISGSGWNLGKFDAPAIIVETPAGSNPPASNGTTASASRLTLVGNAVERDPSTSFKTPWLLSGGSAAVIASANSMTATAHGGLFFVLESDNPGHRIIGNSSPGSRNAVGGLYMSNSLFGSTKGKYFGN